MGISCQIYANSSHSMLVANQSGQSNIESCIVSITSFCHYLSSTTFIVGDIPRYKQCISKQSEQEYCKDFNYRQIWSKLGRIILILTNQNQLTSSFQNSNCLAKSYILTKVFAILLFRLLLYISTIYLYTFICHHDICSKASFFLCFCLKTCYKNNNAAFFLSLLS